MRGNLGRPFRVNIFYDVWSTPVVTTFCCNVRCWCFFWPDIYLYGCLKFIERYKLLIKGTNLGFTLLTFCKLPPDGGRGQSVSKKQTHLDLTPRDVKWSTRMNEFMERYKRVLLSAIECALHLGPHLQFFWGWTRRMSLCPVCLKQVGRLVDFGPSYGCTCLPGWTNLE
jgi:hypothetical protein